MENSFNCIIIDDEELAIGLLKERLGSLYDNLYVTGTYTTWTEGLNALRNTIADIVFLDISLAGKSSIDILKLLPPLESEVIFITAYAEYALDAFSFSATGYIVKPIGDKELTQAVDKAIERVQNKKLSKLSTNMPLAKANKIGIPNNNGIDYIEANDILYFESSSRYTKVKTKNSEMLTSFSIGKFKEAVKEFHFFQVHRSYIVNLNHVRRYHVSGEIEMVNNIQIPVSRNLREDFLRLFNTVTGKTAE